jgi:hypothetical protein
VFKDDERTKLRKVIKLFYFQKKTLDDLEIKYKEERTTNKAIN